MPAGEECGSSFEGGVGDTNCYGMPAGSVDLSVLGDDRRHEPLAGAGRAECGHNQGQAGHAVDVDIGAAGLRSLRLGDKGVRPAPTRDEDSVRPFVAVAVHPDDEMQLPGGQGVGVGAGVNKYMVARTGPRRSGVSGAVVLGEGHSRSQRHQPQKKTDRDQPSHTRHLREVGRNMAVPVVRVRAA